MRIRYTFFFRFLTVRYMTDVKQSETCSHYVCMYLSLIFSVRSLLLRKKKAGPVLGIHIPISINKRAPRVYIYIYIMCTIAREMTFRPVVFLFLITVSLPDDSHRKAINYTPDGGIPFHDRQNTRHNVDT